MLAFEFELEPSCVVVVVAADKADAEAATARRSADVSRVPISTLLGSVVLPESGRNGARSVSSRRCTCFGVETVRLRRKFE